MTQLVVRILHVQARAEMLRVNFVSAPGHPFKRTQRVLG